MSGRRSPRAYAALLSAVAAAVLGLLGSSPAARASNGAFAFTVATVPAVAGIEFRFQGTTHVTGASGTTTFTTPVPLAAFRNPYGLSRLVHLRPTKRANGSIYRLQRWYSKSIHGRRTLIATLREFVPTKVTFVNPMKGRPVPAGQVGRVVAKRSDGAVFTFTGKQLERPVYLQGTRVVPLTGGLVSKNLLYRIQSVTIEGNNLVNRSQQAFLPALDASVTLKLLFYSARFMAADRLFGFATGSGIHLQYPNGRVRYFPFRHGEVDLAALPRGNYRVTVDAAGLKVTSPVAMTRDQVATLKVISYLDLFVLALIAVSLPVGLLLLGRPVLRARARELLVRMWRRCAPSEVARA